MIVRVNTFPIPQAMAAITIGWIIFARPGVGKEIIEHEKVHVAQFKRNPLFPILYLLSKKLRFKWEADAYATSVINGMQLDDAAKFLATQYKLGISEREARHLIAGYMGKVV